MLAARSRVLLHPVNASYLKAQIETGNAFRAKKALQEICKLHRKGVIVKPNDRAAIEQSIIGLLYTLRNSAKVRRWGLNALARLGHEANCLEAIKHVLADFRQEPETVAAGIAAIYRLTRGGSDVLKGLGFDPQMTGLAALQHVEPASLDLTALPLNVEGATADMLKLALIVVGLNRAPPYMLNPRHSNAQMVKVLGAHHDLTVSQYSVWAITENPDLRVSDLGIALKDIEQQAPNVRAWMYQLIAMSDQDAQMHLEYIVLGTSDPEPEARAGLATGLKDTFFDGLSDIVLDWFMAEDDAEVGQLLIDHIIRHAEKCAAYENLVFDFYEKEPQGSARRQRMEATAAGTALYGKMKRIDASNGGDLFRGDFYVTNNYNISGGIQGGAVSIGGDATNYGPTVVHYSPQTIELIRAELAKAERELHSLQIDDAALKNEALERIKQAKAEPTPERLGKVISIIGKIAEMSMKTAGIVTALGTIGEAITKIIGWLPT
jgi:hypothetical protein